MGGRKSINSEHLKIHVKEFYFLKYPDTFPRIDGPKNPIPTTGLKGCIPFLCGGSSNLGYVLITMVSYKFLPLPNGPFMAYIWGVIKN